MAQARNMIGGQRNTGQAARGSGDGERNITQMFALVVGVTYLLVGMVGFAVTGTTGVTTDGADKLLGFDLNVFHNVVHLAIGAGFIFFSRLSDPTITQGVVIGGGLVYVLAALLGFMNELQILSINSELAADNFLHLFSGVAAIFFGLLGARQSDALLPARA